MNITKTLQEIGLSDKEARVYLALLELGSAPASILGQKTGIRRSTAQYVCQDLVDMGLFDSVQKGITIIYSLESPEQLKQMVKQKRQHLLQIDADLDRIMGELKAKQNPHSLLPKVKFYEGSTAIADTYKDILAHLQPNTELITFAKAIPQQDMYTGVQNDIDSFISECVAKKIFTRALMIDTPEARLYKKNDTDLYSETRLIQADSLTLPGGEFVMYEDYSWSLSIEQGKPFGYRVQNKLLIELYRALFEYAWNQAAES